MPPISTFDLLLSLGFVRDDRVFSDDPGGLSFTCGNFHLQASHVMNFNLQHVVSISGTIGDSNTIALVDSQIPQEFDSLELGIAWITWHLDQYIDKHMVLRTRVPWLQVGRQFKHLLPWEIERVARERAPRSKVRRDFARVALRHLAEMVAAVSDDVPVAFTFDGEILSIRVGSGTTAMPAYGTKWATCFSISAGRLRNLPKRLMHDPVEFFVWDNAIRIDNQVYTGCLPDDGRREQ